MNLGFLMQWLIPLSILGVWALTAITNREDESKALPQRVPPSKNPYGSNQETKPQQQQQPQQRPAQRPQPQNYVRTVPTERSPTLRWAPTTTNRPNNTRAGGLDDGIVILEPDRPTRANNQGRGNQQGRRPKNKPVAPSGSRAPQKNSGAQTTASTNVSQTVQQQISASLNIAPLMDSLGKVIEQAVTTKPADVIDVDSAGFNLARVAGNLRDPQRLREAFLVNEILQKPVSLRKR
jgi:hypothetical protein